jgi:hypothetical protein
MTQNNLSSALREQGIRTGGAQGIELLAQAVNAYRFKCSATTIGHWRSVSANRLRLARI